MKDRDSTSSVNAIMFISEIVLGILLLINPIGFTSGIIVALGFVMVCLGIGSIVGYFRKTPEEAAQKNDFAKGLILALLGAFCVFKSEWFIATFPLLTVLYGVLTLVMGISKIQQAIDMLRMKRKFWMIAVMNAVLTIIFSVLILSNPFASTAILWTFIGVTLIIEAIIDLLTVIFGRKQA